MKWYSVKKYRPFIGMDVLATDGEFIYTASYTVSKIWVDTSIDEELGNVTHFCIPEPLEIED